MAHTALRAPHHLSWVVGHAITGEHLIRYTEDDVTPRLEAALASIESASLPIGSTSTSASALARV